MITCLRKEEARDHLASSIGGVIFSTSRQFLRREKPSSYLLCSISKEAIYRNLPTFTADEISQLMMN